MNILLAHNFYKYFAGEDSIALRGKGLLEENKEQVYFYTKDKKETDSYNLNKKINFFVQTIFSSSTKKELKTIIKDFKPDIAYTPVSYTHLRAHETVLDLVCRLLLEKKNTTKKTQKNKIHKTATEIHIYRQVTYTSN